MSSRGPSRPVPDYGPPQSPYDYPSSEEEDVASSATTIARPVPSQGSHDEHHESSLAFRSRRLSDWPVSSSFMSSRRRSHISTSTATQSTRSVNRRPAGADRGPAGAGEDGLETMVKMMQNSSLPGPMMLINDREYLAQGAQFIVFKQRIAISIEDEVKLFNVAVKQPKIDLEPNNEFFLSESTVDRHLKDIYREVHVATRAELKNHPNIAKLLAWSFDPYSFHRCLVLIMEAAVGNMSQVLRDNAHTFSSREKHQLCYDVSYGLQAIHRLDVIHGDLKPGNVLLYVHAGRLVAKLSDFGFAATDKVERGRRRLMGGTPGWMAPEVENNIALSVRAMRLADCYSLGLLIWSVMLFQGDAPPSVETRIKNDIARAQLEAEAFAIKDPTLIFLGEVVHVLLHAIAKARDSGLDILLEDPSMGKSQQAWQGLDDKNMRGVNYNFHYEDIVYKQPTSKWELGPLSHIFLDGLYDRFSLGSDVVKPDLLFLIFLYFSQDDHASGSKRAHSLPTKFKALDAVTASALLNFEPAQAVAERAYQFYGIPAPAAVQGQFLDWRGTATRSGCPLARNELYKTSVAGCEKAMAHFREGSGYSQLHPDGNKVDTPLDPQFAEQYYNNESQLCLLAAYGTPGAMENFLASHRNLKLCQRNDRRENALYLACARGSLEITAMLLDHGADGDARLDDIINQISALHWVIAFDVAEQSTAVSLLVAHGAQLEWRTDEPQPFYHFPFSLPAGTPLHWAVATCSYEAVRALVHCGANVNTRNSWYPYLRDDRIQVLNRFGGPNHESYALGNRHDRVQGLSPLDVAAMQHDPFLFELLAGESIANDINSTDEEGLTVAHRLSHGFLRHTASGNSFDIRPFLHFSNAPRGEYWPKRLERTVRAMISLGANLERLSTIPVSLPPGIAEDQHEVKSTGIGAYTALMYAVRAGSCEVANSLLDAGAQVDTLNDKGETALFRCANTYADPEAMRSCIRLLISHGTNVNHRDNYGTAVIVQLAALCDVTVIELMLAAGASLNEVMHEPNCLDSGLSVLHLLAKEDETSETRYDLAVTQLLEQHVFNLPVKEQKQIVDSAPGNGETILHRYSRFGMLQSVRALITHGANVNAAHHCYRTERINGVRYKVSWCDTPLDEALDSKNYHEQEMEKSQRYSRQQYRALVHSNGATVKALREAGGKETRSKQDRVVQPAEPRDENGAARRSVRPSSGKEDFAWWGDISAEEYKHALDHIYDGGTDSDA